MEKYQRIIQNKRLSTEDLGYTFLAWIMPCFMLFVGLYLVFDKAYDPELFWYRVGGSAIAAFCIYLLYATWKKLRVWEFKNNATEERKLLAIRQLQKERHWKVKKEETNYLVFWENNILIPSYDVTILYDKDGFYINCFPFLAKNWITIPSWKPTEEEIYRELLKHLR